MSAENKARMTASELRSLANACATIMRETVKPEHTQDKPLTLGFSIGEHRFEVKFWHRDASFAAGREIDPVWDQTSIDGVWTGNRCGAVDRLTLLVFSAFEFKP